MTQSHHISGKTILITTSYFSAKSIIICRDASAFKTA